MIRSHQPFESDFRPVRGFSLIEMLVTVALLSVIMIGLVVMFGQVRKAFTGSFTQVDVLQAGRSVADLIAREMEQMASGNSTNIINYFVDTPANPLLTQVNNEDSLTNNLQEVYFLSRNNQQFTGIGYRLTNDLQTGLSSLFRYSIDAATTNMWVLTNQTFTPYNPAGAFITNVTPTTNFIRLIDGVVNFRVRAFDVNGVMYSNVWFTNFSTLATDANRPYVNQSGYGTVYSKTNTPTGDQLFCEFSGTALPAFVEIELGILEDKALTQYKALSISGAAQGSPAYNYLVNHPGQVHVFRQRIAIRNANPAAFP